MKINYSHYYSIPTFTPGNKISLFFQCLFERAPIRMRSHLSLFFYCLSCIESGLALTFILVALIGLRTEQSQIVIVVSSARP